MNYLRKLLPSRIFGLLGFAGLIYAVMKSPVKTAKTTVTNTDLKTLSTPDFTNT